MEEKVLIQSQRYNTKKFLIIALIISVVLAFTSSVLTFFRICSSCIDYYSDCYDTMEEHEDIPSCGESGKCNYCTEYMEYESYFEEYETYVKHRDNPRCGNRYSFEKPNKKCQKCITWKNKYEGYDRYKSVTNMPDDFLKSRKETYEKHLDIPDCTFVKCSDCNFVRKHTMLGYTFEVLGDYYWGWVRAILIFTVLSLISFLIWLWLRSYQMTVTDKRVYGKVIWGRRVDLPVDSISSISTLRIFKGVAVATSSGRIAFCFVKNANEIYPVLNDLIIQRQQEKEALAAKVAAPAPAAPAVSQPDAADQILKFKALLDSGIITQEEFDAKKKQLLNL